MSITRQNSNGTHTETNNNNLDPHQEQSHEIRQIIAETLHSISDVTTTLHSAGVHLPPLANGIGIAAGIGSEILHHSADNLPEELVCGAVIGAAIETVNATLATGAGIVAGTAASAASTPLGGAVVGGAVAIATHEAIESVNEPVRQVAENACRAGFEWGRTLFKQKTQNELTRLEESMTASMRTRNDAIPTRHIDTVQYAGLDVIKGWLSGHPLSQHLLNKELVDAARARHPSLVHYLAVRLLQERAEAGYTDALDYAAQWDLFEAVYQARNMDLLTENNTASAIRNAVASNSMRTAYELSKPNIQNELIRLEESMTASMSAWNDGPVTHLETVQSAGLAVIKGWLSGHPLTHHALSKELVAAARARHPSLVHYLAVRLLQERTEVGYTDALDLAAQWDLFEAFDQAGRMNLLTDSNKSSAMQNAAGYHSHLTLNFLKDLGVTVPQSDYANHNVASNSNGFFAQGNGGGEEISRGKSSSHVYDGGMFSNGSSRSCPSGSERVTGVNGRSGCLGFRF